MASFATVDRQLSGALDDLHDHLWTARRVDEGPLLVRLGRGAASLDHAVRARGTIAAGVRPLVRSFSKTTSGGDLFTFLRTACDLSAAATWAASRPAIAAKRASGLAVSLSIHLASAADRFDLVDAFEAGRADFGAFSSSLADVLEARGAMRAGEFRRATNGTFDIRALWEPRAPKDEQVIAATAATTFAGFACVLFVDALKALGKYRDKPYARLVPATRRILARLGEHP